MRLIKPDGKRYDRIRSARAQLDKDHDNLYSDGQVDMTLGFRSMAASRRLLNIHGSGVSFNVKTGRATTERQANSPSTWATARPWAGLRSRPPRADS